MFQIELDKKQIEQALPDYKYIKRLGSGAFAAVHLVERKVDGEQLAVKKVSCFGMGDYEKSGAANQARILSSLQHKNLIKVFQCLFDNSEDTLYIFMEYADSGDLTTLIQQAKQKKKRVPETTIWKVISDVSDGLQYLHRNQIIHRDLKPANVFRMGKNFKIGDMNISKVLKNGQVASTKTGSPFYTAPEVWQSEQYDNKCDIWSLGVMIYQFCSLQVPYEIQSVFQIVSKIKSQKQKNLPTIYSTSLNELVKKMMDFNPINRISAQQIHKMSLEKLQIETEGLDEKAADNLMKTIVFPDTHQRWVNLIPSLLPKTSRKQLPNNSQLVERQKSKSRQKSKKKTENSSISQNHSGIFKSSQRKPIQLPRNKSRSRLQKSTDQKSDILPPICKSSPVPQKKQSVQKQQRSQMSRQKQKQKQKRDASNSSRTMRKSIIQTVNQAKSIINTVQLSTLQQ